MLSVGALNFSVNVGFSDYILEFDNPKMDIEDADYKQKLQCSHLTYAEQIVSAKKLELTL